MADAIEKTIKDMLFHYELAEKEIRRIRNEPAYAAAFAKVEELLEKQQQCKDNIKRLLHTKDGPPEAVPLGHRSHTWASGDMFKVVMTYKKETDYYNPSKLPKVTLTLPGIVLKVDNAKLDILAAKDARVKHALTSGDWMTPALSLQRRDV
jgi:hypothetical protein